jgi:hypothetical protein
MTTAAPTTRAYLSPAAVAAELSIRRGTVLSWIHRGELLAVNLAERSTGRPRWKISRVAMDEFLARRQCQPPAPRPPRRRRPPANIIEFYK